MYSLRFTKVQPLFIFSINARFNQLIVIKLSFEKEVEKICILWKTWQLFLLVRKAACKFNRKPQLCQAGTINHTHQRRCCILSTSTCGILRISFSRPRLTHLIEETCYRHLGWFVWLSYSSVGRLKHGLLFLFNKSTLVAAPQVLSRKKDIRTFKFPVFFSQPSLTLPWMVPGPYAIVWFGWVRKITLRRMIESSRGNAGIEITAGADRQQRWLIRFSGSRYSRFAMVRFVITDVVMVR